MVSFSAVLLSLASLAVVSSKREGPLRSRNTQSTCSSNPYSAGGNLHRVDHYTGKDFLNEALWTYSTDPDPTNGLVQYVSQEVAVSEGMAHVLPSGAAVLSVDNRTDLALNQQRQSTRISTVKTYNDSLVIVDLAAMPAGCSMWPAFWSYNQSPGGWPLKGEIDVIEGVNQQTTNEMTLHTGPGCTLDENPSNGPSSQGFSGTPLSTNCDVQGGANTGGCGISDTDTKSFGQGFNSNGGGVYARLLDEDGISIWFFERSSIPQDISSGSPDPSSWPIPKAFWSSATCDTPSHFSDHSLVFDTTLCGDWAGNVYGNSGCPGSCAETVAKASNFNQAFWEINYVDVYISSD